VWDIDVAFLIGSWTYTGHPVLISHYHGCHNAACVARFEAAAWRDPRVAKICVFEGKEHRQVRCTLFQ
jgi:hypothetical protein